MKYNINSQWIPTLSPVFSIRIAAGTRIKKPTPTNNNPIANFIGVEGSIFILLSLSQSHAKTPERTIINKALILCHQVEGNSMPRNELFVFLSAKRVSVEPACSNADQNKAAAR